MFIVLATACGNARDGGEGGRSKAEEEKAVLSAVLFLRMAQADFQRLRAIDENGNGVGEFASAGELLGLARRRFVRPIREDVMRLVGPTALRRGPDGTLRLLDNEVHLFLPGGEGRAAGERADGSAEGVDATLAERYWSAVVVARGGGRPTRVYYAGADGSILTRDMGERDGARHVPTAFEPLRADARHWANTRTLEPGVRIDGWRGVDE